MDKSQIRENYNKLSSYLEEVSALRGVSYLLDWDQQVMMPSKSSTFRGKQLSAIAGIIHEKQTNPEIGQLIDTLQNVTDDSLDKWEKANVRDAKRNFDKATKIPKELAQREATLLSKGYETWISAKKDNNFSQFVPILKEWVSLRKEQAKYIDASMAPYDVLLDNYERGLNIEQINNVFDQVKSGLIPLIEKIKSKPSPNKEFLKDKKYDVDVQVKLNHQIAKDLGFDLESGRLDVSAHPFTCEIHSTDVRMTTRYKDDDLMEGISGTVHETGHALYEQGRNQEYSDQPVSSALSMGIHESQSLTWERMVGLSLSFWKRYGPKVLEAFPQIGSNVTAEQFYVAVNEVKPSLIRVEADEVTYPLHIVLRTELERGLIEGTIAVEDLPKLWNERMEKYLGVVPPTDAEGVLQDVHWATGAFGYFPTYLLGAIYASQFFAQAEKELPELYESIEAGNFVPLREWLREKIHSKGSLLPSGDELVKEVTGEALNPKVFLNHLTTKYSKLYNL